MMNVRYVTRPDKNNALARGTEEGWCEILTNFQILWEFEESFCLEFP